MGLNCSELLEGDDDDDEEIDSPLAVAIWRHCSSDFGSAQSSDLKRVSYCRLK